MLTVTSVQPPVLQGAQLVPPQSTPVSSPFWIPSSQVGHAAQSGPPQSTPVSLPFWIPSSQVGHAAQSGPPAVYTGFVAVLDAIIAGRACCAIWATAVYTGFVAVLDAIIAGRACCAIWATTVYTGFVAVLDAIITGRSGATADTEVGGFTGGKAATRSQRIACVISYRIRAAAVATANAVAISIVYSEVINNHRSGIH
jgi:hypothetical protein